MNRVGIDEPRREEARERVSGEPIKDDEDGKVSPWKGIIGNFGNALRARGAVSAMFEAEDCVWGLVRG